MFMQAPVLPLQAPPVAPAIRHRHGVTAAVLISALALLIGLLIPSRLRLPAHPAALVGNWESASSEVPVGLTLQADGGGSFWWRTRPTDGVAGIGRTPLRWRQNQARALKMEIRPARTAGPLASALIEACNSRAVEWRLDPKAGTLRVGPLWLRRMVGSLPSLGGL